MDSYPVTQQLLPIGMNRPGTALNAKGVTIHETATPGATAEAESKYFSSAIRHASAHYFVDYDSIVQLIPENEVAWHAGKTANSRYISIELCHFDDPTRFQAIWQRGVWLCADICHRHGFNPDTDVMSHAWVSTTFHETNHMDPISYFQAHGKTMQDFVSDVKTEMGTMESPTPVQPGNVSAAQPASPVSQVTKTVEYTTALIDGQSVPAVVIDGKSFIGARDVAGLLGYNIAWDDATQRVILTKR